MKFQKIICLNLLLLLPLTAFSQKRINLKSPDHRIVFSFWLTAEAPYYSISFKGQELIGRSALELDFQETGAFGENLAMGRTTEQEIHEYYDLVVGKAGHVLNNCNELHIPLTEKKAAARRVDLVVRAYNDGVAFRYEFPEQQSWTAYTMTEEKTTFLINGDPTVYYLEREHFNTSHEGFYSIRAYSETENERLWDMPALFEFPGNIYMAITEANLRNYAGMYLKKHEGILTSQLSPWQGQTEVKVKASLPHRSPWRVIMIGDKPGTLIESNIITSLNDPCKIEDVSWIKPGKTSFHWWNGDIVPDTTFAPGVNFPTNKYYIDFCSANQLEYHAVIGYGGFAWFPNNWRDYGSPGSYSDLTRTVPSLDMQEVCTYAATKGVDIDVWVHWQALYPQLEEAFTQFEKWGIKGMMVDFLDRDDQEMVNIMEEILQCAARHKLYIQFHGSFKPTGLHRTYPNEFTREGTLNYEHNKWRESPLSPEHDLNIAFVRMLAGASDYHLGGFRAAEAGHFKTQFTRPLMGGTRCHMLGMYVVLESYLQMVADYPDAYRGQAGFDFIREVPTVWDKTVVPAAELQKYLLIAREKDRVWFVGGINNSEERTVEISFGFLEDQTRYTATLYQDDTENDVNPNLLKVSKILLKKGDTIQVKMASGGGLAIKIQPE